MQLAGLATRIDEGGNLIGRREGRNRALPALITGSHSDTVVGGGRFDGIAGILCAIEVAHTLQETGVALRHPLEIIDFLSEEPSDYGVSCVGSRALAGQLTPAMLALQAPDGETLAEGLQRIGAKPAALTQALRTAGSVAAFVELHIEQGSELQAHGIPIGIVTDIVGVRRVALVVQGQADHAGTTSMARRKDALVGAAHIVDAACKQAREDNNAKRSVVATVGRMLVQPNASNAVPARVEMTLEVRSNDNAVLQDFPERLLLRARSDLLDARVTVSMEELTHTGVTTCAHQVTKALAASARRLGYASMRLPSGAGHDTVYMAALAPAGMIFIPCRDGRSHCPDEWAEPEQLAMGAQVLLETLRTLDGGPTALSTSPSRPS